MRSKIFPFAVVAMLVLLSACGNDELLTEKPVEEPEATQTITLTATMPGDDSPATRVALDQVGKDIALTWEEGDKLQLAIVQRTVKTEVETTVVSIDGKKATFDIVLPGINQTEDFYIYGVYGGGGLEIGDANTAPYAILPSNAGSAISLADIQSRKDVMLYFSKKIEAAKPNYSVAFKHLGSLFCITIRNSSSADMLGELETKEVKLVGVNNSTNKKWAYNIGAEGKTFDLVSGKFKDTESGGNYISFTAREKIPKGGNILTLWAWYPPLPEKIWPELQLEMKWKNASGTIGTFLGSNSKKARTGLTAAGKTYYFNALIQGTIDNPTVGFSTTISGGLP